MRALQPASWLFEQGIPRDQCKKLEDVAAEHRAALGGVQRDALEVRICDDCLALSTRCCTPFMPFLLWAHECMFDVDMLPTCAVTLQALAQLEDGIVQVDAIINDLP